MRIDSHQHFWQFDPVRDSWIDEHMKILRRDFMPDDLLPILTRNNMDACIAVQADQSEAETSFLLSIAAKNDFVKAVVAWVDLLADNLTDRLSYYSQNSFFKGVRHIAQGEANDFLTRQDVQKGIGQLEKFGLTYDILVYAHQLPAAIDLVSKFPKQKFVIDHIAKPKISEGMDATWKSNIKQIASFQNVYCKVSGMLTETTNFEWEKSDFLPFLDIIFSEFTTDRVMYGSDWPVCLLAAQYEEQLEIIEDYLHAFSVDEQVKIMGETAISFYNLS